MFWHGRGNHTTGRPQVEQGDLIQDGYGIAQLDIIHEFYAAHRRAPDNGQMPGIVVLIDDVDINAFVPEGGNGRIFFIDPRPKNHQVPFYMLDTADSAMHWRMNAVVIFVMKEHVGKNGITIQLIFLKAEDIMDITYIAFHVGVRDVLHIVHIAQQAFTCLLYTSDAADD